MIRIKTCFGLIRNNSDWFRNRFLNGSHWFGINFQSETFSRVLDQCPTSSGSVSDNELHPGLILPVPDLTRSGHESTRTIPTQFPTMQYSPSLPGRDPAKNLFVMGLTGAISTRVVKLEKSSKFMWTTWSTFYGTCLCPKYINFFFKIWQMVGKMKRDGDRLLLVLIIKKYSP